MTEGRILKTEVRKEKCLISAFSHLFSQSAFSLRFPAFVFWYLLLKFLDIVQTTFQTNISRGAKIEGFFKLTSINAYCPFVGAKSYC